MSERIHFLLAGGDRRQLELAKLLQTDGHRVSLFALGRDERSTPHAAHCVLLPVPAMGPGGVLRAPLASAPVPMEEFLDRLTPEQIILAGQVPPQLAEKAAARGLRLHDYARREEFMVYNAVPAALHKEAGSGKRVILD